MIKTDINMRMIPCEISIFDHMIPALDSSGSSAHEIFHVISRSKYLRSKMCLRKSDQDVYDGLRLLATGAQEAWRPEVFPYLADVV